MESSILPSLPFPTPPLMATEPPIHLQVVRTSATYQSATHRRPSLRTTKSKLLVHYLGRRGFQGYQAGIWSPQQILRTALLLSGTAPSKNCRSSRIRGEGAHGGNLTLLVPHSPSRKAPAEPSTVPFHQQSSPPASGPLLHLDQFLQSLAAAPRLCRAASQGECSDEQ